MLNESSLMAFLATSDAARSTSFYRDILGLTLVEDTPFALVFDAHGVPLRLQKVESASPPAYTSLGWEVSNIREVTTALAQKGIAFERYDQLEQDDLGIWTVPGAGVQVAWFKDPDGNLLSLTQSG